MERDVAVISLGIGITVFLVVAGIISYLLEPFIAFSVFIGIPAGLLAAFGVMLSVIRTADRWDHRTGTSILAGVATFGYTMLVLLAIRYVVPAMRVELDGWTLIMVAMAMGAIISVITWNLRG